MRASFQARPSAIRLVLGLGAGLLGGMGAAAAAQPWPAAPSAIERVQYYRQDDPRAYRQDDPRYEPRYDQRDDRGPYRNDGYRRNDDGYRRGNDGYRGNEGGYRGSLPSGTYQATCQGSRMEGSTLVSNCRGRTGRHYETALDTSRCGRSDIGNNDGTLVCSGARGTARRVD